jgi:CRISPR-associated autoregulator DevR family
MNYSSLSISFRLGLGFHAMNNEGSGGTNVMEPRRISVGDQDYDGISGEMVRRHVFENLVQALKQRGINLSPEGEGLHPDRAKSLIKSWVANNASVLPAVEKAPAKPTKAKASKAKAKEGDAVANNTDNASGTEEASDGDTTSNTTNDAKDTAKLELLPNPHFAQALAYLMEQCAIVDMGGFLAAMGSDEKIERDGKKYSISGTLKRDSVFDVGWLISDTPAVVEFAQHAAYRPDGNHNLFTQNMRAAVYGGVARLDLARIGHNDWAWLTPGQTGLHLGAEERNKRAAALLDAWEQWLLSPAGAKQAGWLQHTGVLEGVLLLSNFGPAPFRSPIEINTASNEVKISASPNYSKMLTSLADKKPTRYQAITFTGHDSLAEAFDKARAAIGLV